MSLRLRDDVARRDPGRPDRQSRDAVVVGGVDPAIRDEQAPHTVRVGGRIVIPRPLPERSTGQPAERPHTD